MLRSLICSDCGNDICHLSGPLLSNAEISSDVCCVCDQIIPLMIGNLTLFDNRCQKVMQSCFECWLKKHHDTLKWGSCIDCGSHSCNFETNRYFCTTRTTSSFSCAICGKKLKPISDTFTALDKEELKGVFKCQICWLYMETNSLKLSVCMDCGYATCKTQTFGVLESRNCYSCNRTLTSMTSDLKTFDDKEEELLTCSDCRIKYNHKSQVMCFDCGNDTCRNILEPGSSNGLDTSFVSCNSCDKEINLSSINTTNEDIKGIYCCNNCWIKKFMSSHRTNKIEDSSSNARGRTDPLPSSSKSSSIDVCFTCNKALKLKKGTYSSHNKHLNKPLMCHDCWYKKREETVVKATHTRSSIFMRCESDTFSIGVSYFSSSESSSSDICGICYKEMEIVIGNFTIFDNMLMKEIPTCYECWSKTNKGMKTDNYQTTKLIFCCICNKQLSHLKKVFANFTNQSRDDMKGIFKCHRCWQKEHYKMLGKTICWDCGNDSCAIGIIPKSNSESKDCCVCYRKLTIMDDTLSTFDSNRMKELVMCYKCWLQKHHKAMTKLFNTSSLRTKHSPQSSNSQICFICKNPGCCKNGMFRLFDVENMEESLICCECRMKNNHKTMMSRICIDCGSSTCSIRSGCSTFISEQKVCCICNMALIPMNGIFRTHQSKSMEEILICYECWVDRYEKLLMTPKSTDCASDTCSAEHSHSTISKLKNCCVCKGKLNSKNESLSTFGNKNIKELFMCYDCCVTNNQETLMRVLPCSSAE